MNLDAIIGNEEIKRAFQAMARTGRVPHALLLHENEGGGALPLVLGFIELLSGHSHYEWNTHFSFPISSGTKVSGAVKDLTCDDFARYWRELLETNPYFLENELSAALGIEKKSGVIAVAEGKSILQKLSLSGDGYRFMVIWLPEKMNPQTANMLLKSIEEPSEQTVFILVTHSPEDVLVTISSRCQRMRVLPLSPDEVARTLVSQRGVDPEEAAQAAAYSDGSVGMALQFLSGEGDAVLFQDLFADLVGSLADRKLGAVLEVGEALAALDSRERQKGFCLFAGSRLRKVFLLQQGMEAVAAIPPQEAEFYKDAAARLGKTFCRKALDILGRTVRLLERNVGQKILFCNMMTRLWASV
ncbi:MAG: hypothetical protein IJ578_00490 [Bacteroidales bacterium]|nr:hypothetical protein [Bacteroidales bacterium]